MDTSMISDVLRDAVGVAIKVGGPILILCLLVGLIVAIFQAVTQIHEQSIGFLLKLIAVIAVLMIGGGWMLSTLTDYAKELMLLIAS